VPPNPSEGTSFLRFCSKHPCFLLPPILECTKIHTRFLTKFFDNIMGSLVGKRASFPKQKDGKISGNYQIAVLLHDIFLLQKVGEGFVQLFLGQLQAEELCDVMTLAVGE